ncbi:MAG TPA: hypothetical protein VJU15_09915 [Gemmatimonadales bacterium]|nr:hypothetical protein [Gemmatimonadales bacterium]
MRSDMHKVIVERARRGGRVATRPGRHRDYDDLPAREGMRRRHVLAGSEKALNEHLAPLERYLRKQVGRPWNAIYRDINRRLRPDSAVQLHVRQHIGDFVEFNVELGARGVVHGAVHARFGAGRFPLRAGTMYVHPNTGLLALVRRRTVRM